MTDQPLPRHTRSSRPQFFEEPGLDQMMSVVLGIAQELSVLRDRVDSVERLLDAKGSLTRAELEAYRPDAAADIKSAGVSPLDLALLVLRLMAQRVIPVGGVGIYPGFVHVDNRGRLASWRGSGVDDSTFARFRSGVADCATCIRISMEVSTDD